MEFSEKLLIGEGVEDGASIVQLLEQGTKILGIYLLCINKKTDNIFEIIKSTEIYKPMYDQKNYLVVGVAESKKEAVKLAEGLLEYYYSHNHLDSLKKHLLRKF